MKIEYFDAAEPIWDNDLLKKTNWVDPRTPSKKIDGQERRINVKEGISIFLKQDPKTLLTISFKFDRQKQIRLKMFDVFPELTESMLNDPWFTFHSDSELYDLRDILERLYKAFK